MNTFYLYEILNRIKSMSLALVSQTTALIIRLTLAGLTALLFSQPSLASTIKLSNFHEADLIDIGSTQKNAHGPGNLRRIENKLNQYRNASGKKTTVNTAKQADFFNAFSLIDNDDNFIPLKNKHTINKHGNKFTFNNSDSSFRPGLNPLDIISCRRLHCLQPKDQMTNAFVNDDLTIRASSASVVPIPASIWLFGSGMLGLIGLARRNLAV